MVRSIDTLRWWLVPLIVADFSLVPMLHLGSVPWKPGYVLLVIAVPLYLTAIPVRPARLARTVATGFAVLIAVTLLGAIYFEAKTGAGLAYTTGRSTLIYAVAAMAFFAGLMDRRQNHGYLLGIIAMFFLLNIAVTVAPSTLSLLSDFYGVNDRLSSIAYQTSARVPGIFENPNITALTSTVLAIMVAAGIRWGWITPSARTAVFTLSLAFGVAMLMLSRNQLIAVVLVGMFLLIYLPRVTSLRTAVAMPMIGVTAVTLLLLMGDRQADTFGVDITGQVSGKMKQLLRDPLGQEQPDAQLNSLKRPLLGFSAAYDRWQVSPAIGTGFEPAPGIPEARYHNDWATVLASGGLVGLAALLVVAIAVVRIDPVLVIPFILPGLTNSFIFVPQHLVIIMLVAGMVAARRWGHMTVPSRPSDAAL